MKVAAWQAPLLAAGCMDAIDLIHECVCTCEAQGIDVLCCPEAVLGGLADYDENPKRLAIRSDNGQLESVLAPLASDTVTCVVGFTELATDGALYNAAAIFQRGRVAGLYRKIHPAIRRSVYAPGSEIPVFRAGELMFGVMICNDSNYPELARMMTAQGASVLFIPTNNSLPNGRAGLRMNAAARKADIALAEENRIWVVRADFCGRNDELTSYGASEIVDPEGNLVRQARDGSTDLLVAEIIDTLPHGRGSEDGDEPHASASDHGS
ncbi:MAG TPA: carbon-nitrogen hydrolase family protein [Bryobacteraceae bacterium]|nr:carbon-nitrogen hydrolase family protein [Bryobacteraceae bacterium]